MIATRSISNSNPGNLNSGFRRASDERILRRRKKKVERALRAESEPAPPPPVGEAPPADGWHFIIQDADKQARCGKATAAELREWVASGKLAPAQVLLSRRFDGQYRPLSAIDEFKGAAPKSSPPAQAPAR